MQASDELKISCHPRSALRTLGGILPSPIQGIQKLAFQAIHEVGDRRNIGHRPDALTDAQDVAPALLISQNRAHVELAGLAVAVNLFLDFAEAIFQRSYSKVRLFLIDQERRNWASIGTSDWGLRMPPGQPFRNSRSIPRTLSTITARRISPTIWS